MAFCKICFFYPFKYLLSASERLFEAFSLQEKVFGNKQGMKKMDSREAPLCIQSAQKALFFSALLNADLCSETL